MPTTDPIDRLTAAYEKMLQRVHDTLEEAGRAAAPVLRRNIDQAREKAVELGELTREEADKVAGYLQRDMEEAARFMTETGEQLSAWWRTDLELIEQRLLDAFAAVADQTRLQLERFAEMSRRASLYHTGEVAGPGTLICGSCGKALHFHKAGRIPPCSGCRGTEFRRTTPEDAGAAD